MGHRDEFVEGSRSQWGGGKKENLPWLEQSAWSVIRREPEVRDTPCAKWDGTDYYNTI
jgi:hypothetical protein